MSARLQGLAALVAEILLVAAGTAAMSPARTPRPLPAPVAAAAAAIQGARIAADIGFLSDDALEGRATGTRGFRIGAAYVANRFAALGLEPGDTTWYQEVPIRVARLDPAASSVTLVRDGRERPLRIGADVLVAPDASRARVTTEASLVLAGFGVSAPELGHDDFRGLDVAGKVVVEFAGAPPRFSSDEKAYFGNRQVKELMAAAHGAAGVLLVTRPTERARAPWPPLVHQWSLPVDHWTDAGGVPTGVQAGLGFIGRIADSTAGLLFEGAAKTLDQAAADADSGIAGGFPLAASLRTNVVSNHAAIASPNVVAFVRGSDPRLADQAIVLTAHLDHLGISAPVAGDSINNGAYDNASGVATLLEVARAFSRMPSPPRRSIVFVALTGEEEGLLGSDYLARHALPLGARAIAEINLDELLVLRPVSRVVAIGAEHSTLGPVVERAARLAGLEVIPNPAPETVPLVRSDQFSFVMQGVPSVFPRSGADGTPEGLAEIRKWMSTRYHTPGDDKSQPFDWDSSARFARFVFATAWLVSDAPHPPHWNAGDFFGRRFAPAP